MNSYYQNYYNGIKDNILEGLSYYQKKNDTKKI